MACLLESRTTGVGYDPNLFIGLNPEFRLSKDHDLPNPEGYLSVYSAPKNWRIIGCISMACSF